MGGFIVQPFNDFSSDVLSGHCESGRIVVLGSSEINAMGAILTIYKIGYHATLGLGVMNFHHSSVLPGIFNSIHKVDFLALNVQASILFNVVVNLGFTNLSFKDSFTVWNPEVGSNSVRSNIVLSVRNLEPSKLSAILPSPLSHIIIEIIGFVSQ